MHPSRANFERRFREVDSLKKEAGRLQSSSRPAGVNQFVSSISACNFSILASAHFNCSTAMCMNCTAMATPRCNSSHSESGCNENWLRRRNWTLSISLMRVWIKLHPLSAVRFRVAASARRQREFWPGLALRGLCKSASTAAPSCHLRVRVNQSSARLGLDRPALCRCILRRMQQSSFRNGHPCASPFWAFRKGRTDSHPIISAYV